MECFVIFVMAWCWCNATESKPQNVNNKFEKNDEKNTLFKNNIDNNIYNAKYKLWK